MPALARRLRAHLGHGRRHGELRDGSCAETVLLLALARIGAGLVAGGLLLVTGSGLWLVALGHWGYATPWVDAAVGLLALVGVIGSMGGQRPKLARKLADALAALDLPSNAESRARLGDRRALVLTYLAATALLAIIVLMVVKPGSPHQ